eukprot:gene5912-7114_t
MRCHNATDLCLLMPCQMFFVFHDAVKIVALFVDEVLTAGFGEDRGKRYGVECDLVRRITKPPRFQMPDWLQVVMQRMREVGPPVLADFHPNECNAIDYRRDEGAVLGSIVIGFIHAGH